MALREDTRLQLARPRQLAVELHALEDIRVGHVVDVVLSVLEGLCAGGGHDPRNGRRSTAHAEES